MDAKHDLLFVYGTLLFAENQFAQYLNAHSTFYKKARFKGKLYNIGHYPGAILHTRAPGYVYGSIYKLDDPDEVFSNLDGYEGISAENPLPHEYTRELVEMETDEGPLTSWVYLYNWPVDEDSLIVSGDYLKFKL
ncbi:MAG: gamma-glutamylcyclotransferase family protein [Mucilaginibacter sp.]